MQQTDIRLHREVTLPIKLMAERENTSKLCNNKVTMSSANVDSVPDWVGRNGQYSERQ